MIINLIGWRKIPLFLFFLFPVRVFSQTTGIVYDSLTLEPIENAHVYTSRLSVGTITDKLGRFQLTQKIEDSLMISHIGYRSAQINMTSDPDSNNFKVFLQPHQSILNEIVVEGKMADISDIISRALENYSKNYHEVKYNGHLKQSIYQDSVCDGVFSAPVTLFQKKKIFVMAPDTENILNVKRKPSVHSFVHNSNVVDFFNLDQKLQIILKNISSFSLKKLNTDYFAGNEIYVINLKWSNNSTESSSMRLFIEKEEFAIIRLELFGKFKEKWTNINTPYLSQVQIKKTSTRGIISYRPYQGKWMLSKVSANIVTKVRESSNHIRDRVDNIFISIAEIEKNKNKPKGQYIDVSKDIFHQFESNIPDEYNTLLLPEEQSLVNQKIDDQAN